MMKLMICLAAMVAVTWFCVSAETGFSEDELDRLVLDDVQPTDEGGDDSRVQFAVIDGVPSTRAGGAGFQFQMRVTDFNFVGGGASTEPTYWYAGAEHHFIGTLDFRDLSVDNFILGGYQFEGDADYPLVMKLVKDRGYVYLCGRGTIRHKDGREYHLGGSDSTVAWLDRLASGTSLDREGAVQALGFLALALTESDKRPSVSALLERLVDESAVVRRGAAESLGKIADDDETLSALRDLTEEARETDEWVREVAAEAVERILARM